MVNTYFVNYAEKAVQNDLDAVSFEAWYKELNVLHRRLPRDGRKPDSYFCQILITLFFAQPVWRDKFEVKLEVKSAAESDLDDLLVLIRDMLLQRESHPLRRTLFKLAHFTCRHHHSLRQ